MSLLRYLSARERAIFIVSLASLLFGLIGVTLTVPGVVAGDSGGAGSDPLPAIPAPLPPDPADDPADDPAGSGAPGVVGAATTTAAVVVRSEASPDAAAVSSLRAGILLPVTGARDGFYAVMTPCEVEGWLPADAVVAHTAAASDRPQHFDQATFVLDAGHGGRDPGAVGPTGLTEKEANLEIVRLLTEMLSAPRSLNPDTGRVEPGEIYGTPRVFLTRDSDYWAGLAFRAKLATTLRAHAFISIHNNAVPDEWRGHPGTETYYQFHSPDSRRLAGLIYEELLAVLERHEVDWVGDFDAGAKYRRNQRGEDYYGLLRRSEVPSVLVEALFISNPPEEALLRDPEVQRELAEAHYRALVRYITTEDSGSGFVEPYDRPPGPPSGRPSSCVDPA